MKFVWRSEKLDTWELRNPGIMCINLEISTFEDLRDLRNLESRNLQLVGHLRR